MAYADQVPGSRRFGTIAGVAVIHGVIGYALVSGMAVDIVRAVHTTLTTSNVPLPVPPPPDTPKPVERTLPRTTAPTATVPLDPILPTRPADTAFPVDVIAVPLLPPLLNDGSDISPVVSKAAGPQAQAGKGAWITTFDYPASAIRAEQEGVVGISVRIGADGRVTSCSVSASSGVMALDDAACRFYQRRARFVPARDEAGAAIASSYNDRVRWQLPR